MRVLVTGGQGFVGGSIVTYLAAQPDVEVVLATDLTGADLKSGEKVEPVLLDVLDGSALHALLDRYAPTHLIHAAAITASGPAELNQASKTISINVSGAAEVFEVAAQHRAVERLVLISSSGVYGTPTDDLTQPELEDGPLRLGNLYAISKYSAELVARRIAALAEKPFAAIRLPGIYGPLERLRPTRPQVSVMRQLRDVLAAGTQVTVAGETIARDWTYADDMAAGIHALLQTEQWSHPVYNVSVGQLATFAEVVEAFVAHGLQAEWVDDAVEADIAMLPIQARRPLSIERLMKDSEFVPRYDVRAGVAAWLAAEGTSPD